MYISLFSYRKYCKNFSLGDLILAKKAISPATKGTFEVLQGDLATENLVVPKDYDRSLYYLIKDVLVKPNSTVPSNPGGTDFSNVLFYNENTGEPTEWVATSSSANIVVNSPNNPQGGSTVSIEATNPLNIDKAILSTTTPISTSLINDGSFSFWLDLKEDVGNSYIFTRWKLGNTTLRTYLFRTGTNGFDSSNLAYQKITIDGSKINLPSGTVDTLEWFIFRSGYSGYFLDKIELNIGSGGNVVPTQITPNLQEVTDVGNETTNDIIVNSEDEKVIRNEIPSESPNNYSELRNDGTITAARDGHYVKLVGDSPQIDFKLNPFIGVLYPNITDDRSWELPDKIGTIALLDDVIEEAPKDGKEYNRKDGQWIEDIVEFLRLGDTLRGIRNMGTGNDIDLLNYDVHVKTLTANTTITFSNITKHKPQTFDVTGTFTLTLPSEIPIAKYQDYDGTKRNLIYINCIDDTLGSELYDVEHKIVE